MRYFVITSVVLLGLNLLQQAAAQTVPLPRPLSLRETANSGANRGSAQSAWRPSRGTSAARVSAPERIIGINYAPPYATQPQPQQQTELAVYLDEPEPRVREVTYQATQQGLAPSYNTVADYQQYESGSIWEDTEPVYGGYAFDQAVDFSGVGARLGGGYRYGEDVGLDDNFLWFQGFAPIFQRPGESVVFADFRGLAYDDSGEFGANGTAGYRFYHAGTDRVYGAYGGYDYQRANTFNYGQVTGGLETLGNIIDARANGYAIVSEKENTIAVSDPYFINNNIQFDTTQQRAMSGFDVEVGANLTPNAERMAVRVFGGGYGFLDGSGNDAWGPRGRVEVTLFDTFIGEGSIQNDDIFGTTAYVSLAVLLGSRPRAGANSCNGSSVVNRLGDPIHKNMHIVLQERADTALAVNPDTNSPYQVLHADSNAAAGGDGSFENPYNTLTETEANNNAGIDIVLLHAGSQFTNEDIALPFTQQRLLGDGLSTPHTFASQFGTLALPRANNLNARPVIADAPGAAVTISADDVEVSGLSIQNATTVGISGANLTGLDINRNLIANSTVGGISLAGTNQGNISDNVLTDNGNFGIGISTFSGGTIRDNVMSGSNIGMTINTLSGGTVSDNTASNHGTVGYLFSNVSGGTISNNSASNSQSGFQFLAVSGGTIEANASRNNTAEGFGFASVTGGTIQENVATDNGEEGFNFLDVSGGVIQNNFSSANGTDGFTVINFSDGLIQNNLATFNGSDGFEIGSADDGVTVGSWSGGALNNNVSNNNVAFGYRVNNRTGGSAAGNTAAGNGDNTLPTPGP